MPHEPCVPTSSHWPDCLCDPPATPRCAYVPQGVLKASSNFPDPVCDMNRFTGLYLPWESSGYCAALFNSLKDGVGPRVNVVAMYREGIGQNYEPGVRLLDTAKEVERFWDHRTDYLENMLHPSLEAATAQLLAAGHAWHNDPGGGAVVSVARLFCVWNYFKDCDYRLTATGRHVLLYGSGKGWRVVQNPVVLDDEEATAWLADRDAWVPLRQGALDVAEAQYAAKYPHEY